MKDWWPLILGIPIGVTGGWGMVELLFHGSKLWSIPAFVMFGYVAFWLIKAILIIKRLTSS